MSKTKSKPRGLEAFNDYFQSVYQERWPQLLEALKSDGTRSAMINPFANMSDEDLRGISLNDGERVAPPHRADNGVLSHYVLDGASQIAANALPLEKGDRILDMCAAPGGKALGLLFRSDKSNHFVLNERSATRRARLHKVIEDYIPQDSGFDIKVTGHDATRWCLHETNAYEAIFLDAPCSSERHLLEKPQLIEQWSTHRTFALALQQFAMLASGAAALKPLGHLLYATCSISPKENDEVIAKLLKKREQFEVIGLRFDSGEKTEHGWIFLPDKTQMGPLFLSLIRRKNLP